MEEINVVNKINHASSWLNHNQELIIHYIINIIFAIVILFIGLLTSKIVNNTLNRMMIIRRIDTTVSNFISVTLRYGIIIFTFITALNSVGIQTTSIIAVIGAAGLAVGLALQSSLSNFAAGVLLVTFRYFHVGDYVDFAGTSGTVIMVQILSTILRTHDGKIIIVPNNKILSGNIINFSKEPNRLINTIISVNYDANIDIVKKIITDILTNDNRIIQNMGLIVRLKAIGPFSLDFIVRAWVPRSNQQNVTFDLLEKVKVALDTYNIGMPYSKINVHLSSNVKI